MFNTVRKELDWGGRRLVMETGRVARQADGAVLVTYGDTAVLCVATAAKQPNPDVDFFPLTVNYQEKTYAAGKIPGGFFKREGRPSEKETLTSRLIDRPIRPLFPGDFRNETQVICTVLSYDQENDPDIVAMVGASAALTLSGIPFLGPIAGARVGFIDGEYALNPQLDELTSSDLDLIVAGTGSAVLMVESEASELSEEEMLGAVMYGHEQMQPVIDMIIEMAEEAAKEPWELVEDEGAAALEDKVADMAKSDMEEAYGLQVKQERSDRLNEIRQRVHEAFDEDEGSVRVSGALKKIEKTFVRGQILESGARIDGRKTDEVRPISAEVGVLPRTHGAALFTRGETQALVVTTLGTGEDEQIIDALEGSYREHFLLHYNFPPYSVGETGRVGFTGRREVGHGKLAWRALKALMPSQQDFPYTIRIVSEITESNGSSSMATVCGSSLSLMDAGVPIKRPIAGIAMGLILEEDGRFAVLSDILGDEDHLGDMDFKVAGTDQGITSLQMDIKVTGITQEIMQTALDQAKDGRLHILSEMAKAIAVSRSELKTHAPRIETITIPRDKIREVIGTGGKVIREICEVTGAKIDIEDDGTIRIAAADGAVIDQAKNWIQDIVAEPEIGEIYDGKVVKVLDFGAFVNFIGDRDGLVHISELAPRRVNKVTDVVNEGDEVKVKVLDIDDRGKVRLSMRVVDQESGEEIEAGQGGKDAGKGKGDGAKSGKRGGGRGREKAKEQADE